MNATMALDRAERARPRATRHAVATKHPTPASEADERAKPLTRDHAERVASVARNFDALPAECREHFAREAADKLPPP
jgi:hypothetical protein